MTNFAHFLEQCKTSSFACQIFLKNNQLLLIKNDLDALRAVDEEQIFYFKGAFRQNTGRFNGYDCRMETDSRLSGGRIWSRSLTPFPLIFGDELLYRLAEKGVDLAIVNDLLPVLYENYATDEDWQLVEEERYQEFKRDWKGCTRICRRAYWFRATGMGDIVLQRRSVDGDRKDARFDNEAVGQFLAFCDAVKACLQEEGEIVERRISREHMTEDFAFVLKCEEGEKAKCLSLFISTTDPKSPDVWVDYFENGRLWTSEHLESQLPATSQSGIRHYDVVINGKTYHSYEEALETVKAILQDPKKEGTQV